MIKKTQIFFTITILLLHLGESYLVKWLQRNDISGRQTVAPPATPVPEPAPKAKAAAPPAPEGASGSVGVVECYCYYIFIIVGHPGPRSVGISKGFDHKIL